MSSFKIAPNALAAGNIGTPSGSAATLLLNAAYVAGTSGPAVAFRIVARSLEPITAAYVYATAFGGSKANFDMRCRVWAENPSQPTRPNVNAGDILATSDVPSIQPAGSAGWIRCDFSTPYTPTVIGEVLWLVFQNFSSSPATETVTLRSTTPVAYPSQSYRTGFSTTNGFTSNGAVQNRLSCIFVQGGSASGLPWTNTATPLATNNRARGFFFTPPNDVKITALELQTAVGATMTGISIWESTQVPTDTPIYQFNTGQTGRASSELSGVIGFEPEFMARKGKSYYIMWTVSANSTTPPCTRIEDYAANASVFNTLYDDFTMFPLAYVNASNQFVIDREYQPRLQVLLGSIDQPTVTRAF